MLLLLNLYANWMQADSTAAIRDTQKLGFDLGVFVGDLALDEDASRYNNLLPNTCYLNGYINHRILF